MRIFSKIFNGVVTFSLLALACISVAATETTPKTYTNPDKPIMLSQGESQFTLELKSNPTTGYSWFLGDYNESLLIPVKREYIAPKSDRIGAGGYELWTFKVKPEAFEVPQIFTLQMVYTQPWEVDQHNIDVFTVITHRS